MDYKTLESVVGHHAACAAEDELSRIINKELDEYDYVPVVTQDKKGRKVYVIGRRIQSTSKSDYAVVPVSKMFSAFE